MLLRCISFRAAEPVQGSDNSGRWRGKKALGNTGPLEQSSPHIISHSCDSNDFYGWSSRASMGSIDTGSGVVSGEVTSSSMKHGFLQQPAQSFCTDLERRLPRLNSEQRGV